MTTIESARATPFERFAANTVLGVVVTPFAAVLAFLIGIVFLPVMLLNAWVLVKLWAWFIVPNFGLPALPFVAAAGIVLIVRHVTPIKVPAKDDEKKHDTLTLTILSVVMPFYTLGLGWFIHWVF